MRALCTMLLLALCGCPPGGGDGTTSTETDSVGPTPPNPTNPTLPTGPTTNPTGPTPPTTNTTAVELCAESPGASLCNGNVAVVCDDAGSVLSAEACAAETFCDLGECLACGPEALFSVPIGDSATIYSRGIRLEVDTDPALAERVALWRAVTVHTDLTVTLDGPLEVITETGDPVITGDSLPRGTRLLARGTEIGFGSIGLDNNFCGADLLFESDLPRSLAGRPLDGFPWFEAPDLFVAEDDTVHVSVDPGVYFDRVGLAFDASIVAVRTAAEWAADPTITPIVGPVAGTVDGTTFEIWASPDPGVLSAGYSLVIDFDRNGLLDPGDLVDGFDGAGFTVVGDLSAPGPYTVESEDYSVDFWHTFRAYWPVELDLLDPIPLVVVSHGNGHDYTWYDYLGEHFASHGWAMIAHRNDTGPTDIIPAANTTWENTDLFLADLPVMFGGVLDGEIDTHRIAWIGHSRGGEGVVIAYNGVKNGQIVPSNFTASDVVLVSSIAPTVWTTPELADPNDVIYHQMDGSADGDVTGDVSSGITQYFRIFQGATNLNAVTYVRGATHNDFNCCGFNDGQGVTGPKIGRTAAQQLAKSYYLAMLKAVFEDEDVMWELFSRNPERFRPAGVESGVTTSLRRGAADVKVVLDNFQLNSDVLLSSAGTVVAYTVDNLEEGALRDGTGDLTASMADPFNGMSWVESGDTRPDRGVVFEWPDGADMMWEVAVPAGEEDLRDDALLSFRVAQGTRHPYTVALGDRLSFSVELEDAAGVTSMVDFRVYGGVNPPYARTGSGVGTGWVNEFQTVRIPLADFAADGSLLDLSQITTVRFRFGVAYGSSQGRVGLDDIEILKEVLP